MKINRIVNDPGWNENRNKYTFVMYLVDHGIYDIPKEWYHNPEI